MGNVPFIGTMPTTDILVRDQYEDKVLVMPNSTYLAEIQKLAQLMGVTLYQNQVSGQSPVPTRCSPDSEILRMRKKG